MRHTKGPWKVSPAYSDWVVWADVKKGEPFPYIAQVHKKEDALLIAAAPSLYAVCIELLKEDNISSKTKEAIKKALSESVEHCYGK